VVDAGIRGYCGEMRSKMATGNIFRQIRRRISTNSVLRRLSVSIGDPLSGRVDWRPGKIGNPIASLYQ